MRVGVYFNDLTPTDGGGYTFQNAILRSLIDFGSRHKFILFGNVSTEELIGKSGAHVQFVSLRGRGSQRVTGKLGNMMSQVFARFAKTRERFDRFRGHWLKPVMRNLDIEILWFVSPCYLETDIPFVFTVWDLQHRLQPWFPEVGSGGQWVRREALYFEAIPKATAIIVGADAGRDEIVRFYGVPPERVLLNPHPTPGFALRAPRGMGEGALFKYGISKNFLLYPAQFWPHKNHVGLLMAAKLLEEKYDLRIPIVLVGSDHGNLGYVRRVAQRLGLSNRVFFLGFVPQEDLVGLYRHALALTYVTFFGPENLPPLEAFALGCPVIASNVAGSAEQLGDAALLVNPTREEEIADAIHRLIGDPILRETLVKKGMKRAASWTSDHYVQKVIDFFDEFERVRRCLGIPGSANQ